MRGSGLRGLQLPAYVWLAGPDRVVCLELGLAVRYPSSAVPQSVLTGRRVELGPVYSVSVLIVGWRAVLGQLHEGKVA